MRVGIINFSDLSGGASRAAYRLHNSLLKAEVDSRMQVWLKVSDNPTVIGNSNKIGRIITEIRTGIGLLATRLSKTDNKVRQSCGVLPSGWVKRLNASDLDIINLHWVGAETLSIYEIAQIRKPVVWTFHDMWAFCGAEHYAEDTVGARWREGYLADNRPIYESGFDLNRWIWKFKQLLWKKPFHIVCPSHWLADCVRNSALMHNWPVTVIPNPLDLNTFQPIEQKQARQLLNLPQHKSLILFGALGGTSDYRKGGDLLFQALTHIKNEHLIDIELVILGESKPLHPPTLGFPIHYMCQLNDDIALALLYSAVNIFVTPSRQDNLPNTVAEAMACGTPTVAFRIGGIPDLVEHQISGYLCHPFDPEDLAQGIKWALEMQQHSRSLNLAARLRAESLLNPEKIVNQYLSVYEQARIF